MYGTQNGIQYVSKNGGETLHIMEGSHTICGEKPNVVQGWKLVHDTSPSLSMHGHSGYMPPPEKLCRYCNRSTLEYKHKQDIEDLRERFARVRNDFNDYRANHNHDGVAVLGLFLILASGSACIMSAIALAQVL